MNIIFCNIIMLFVLLIANCTFASDKCVPPTDYSNSASWVIRPKTPNKKVDVFYVYPTVYADSQQLNMDCTDSKMLAKIKLPLNSQLTAYSQIANTYVPFYRQMSGTLMSYDGDLESTEYFSIARNDVISAFKYYISKLNLNRPFILAGHSQGSMMLIELMHEIIMADPSINKRLIAAYLIGYTVFQDDPLKYPWMRLAEKSNDVGVIISFNTQSSSATNSPILLKGAYCINPLNWSTGYEKVGKDYNSGAVFFNNDGTINREIKNYCGAYIDPYSHALIAAPPEELDVRSFPPGIYHIYDYAFWYRNIEQNVKERVSEYLSNNK